MNIYAFGLFLITSLCFAQSNWFSWTTQLCAIKAPKTVRILLHELKTTAQSILLECNQGFILQESSNKKTTLHLKKLIITYNGNTIFINKIPYKKSVIIYSKDLLTKFKQKNFLGSFEVNIENNALLLINCINLEDYIYSVLKTESWPGWPLEMNKVLAITCRTYALSMIEEAVRKKRIYHVTNTNRFQTYHGNHTSPLLRQAVDETKGIIVHHNKKPILAMYDSCCGGIVPARVHHINANKTPYLARPYACRYCKTCKLYNWQITIPIEQFAHKSGHNPQHIHAVTITKKDNAGLVQEAMIKGKNILTSISGQKLYAFSKDIKSFCFDIYKKSKSIIIKGYGFGHHIGLCQWGAREMVKRGYDYKKILAFYYPDTALGKVI